MVWPPAWRLRSAGSHNAGMYALLLRQSPITRLSGCMSGHDAAWLESTRHAFRTNWLLLQSALVVDSVEILREILFRTASTSGRDLVSPLVCRGYVGSRSRFGDMVQLIRCRILGWEENPWLGKCGCGNPSSGSVSGKTESKQKSIRWWWKASYFVTSCYVTYGFFNRSCV